MIDKVMKTGLFSLLQELGKTWEEVQSEDDREMVEDEDE